MDAALLTNRWRLSIRVVGRVAILLGDALIASITGPRRWRMIFLQMVEIGVKSLPIVSITAVFTGMVLAFQTAYQISRFGAEIYVGGIVAISMARELGPVLTALVVAGRVGAGITAEIGTMRVTEQIDAMEAMGVEPIDYLVVPRFMACILMLPVLTVYGDFIGYIGGYIVGVFKLGLNPAQFIERTQYIVTMWDILNGLSKSFFFAAIISTVGCYMGFNSRGGAEGVGRATTISVVASSMLILTADYFLTATLYLLS